VSDATVRQALRSGGTLVVIEAPAGCGKTHQGAEYVGDLAAASTDRVLILTHTHAACSVFAKRTQGLGSHVEIRTIDSLIAQIATVYHVGIGVPSDPMIWVRQTKDGYAALAIKVASLLQRYPMIARAVAARYPTIVCDEHQDSSRAQHAIVASLVTGRARLRAFADPMQRIFKDADAAFWDELVSSSDVVESLDYPHRWDKGCPRLGAWTLKAREDLKAGRKVDLRTAPSSVVVVQAENIAETRLGYRVATSDRSAIDTFAGRQSSLLVLTRHNETALSLRSFFGRRILLWEGYTRSALESFVQRFDKAKTPETVAKSILKFMDDVAVGFSPSGFGNRFESEVGSRCAKMARGKPALIQELAKLVIAEPNHRGASKMLKRLHELSQSNEHFDKVQFDAHREFWDAIKLGDFDNPSEGLVDLAHRRSYARPQPTDRAISTIHKAKGLECESVLVMPCDNKTFPDELDARCLLYVALSRAKSELMVVVSTNNPSPLLTL